MSLRLGTVLSPAELECGHLGNFLLLRSQKFAGGEHNSLVVFFFLKTMSPTRCLQPLSPWPFYVVSKSLFDCCGVRGACEGDRVGTVGVSCRLCHAPQRRWSESVDTANSTYCLWRSPKVVCGCCKKWWKSCLHQRTTASSPSR